MTESFMRDFFVMKRETPEPTLRDQFAMAALPLVQNIVGATTIGELAKEVGIKAIEYDGAKHYPLIVARRAYLIADAMLEARKP